jgi:hypothetical protein
LGVRLWDRFKIDPLATFALCQRVLWLIDKQLALLRHYGGTTRANFAGICGI